MVASILVLLATMEAALATRGPLTMSGPVRIEKSPSEIALTWLDEQTLEMKLADNTTHQILLSVAENIPGIVDPCLFSGVIVGDPESLVSVSGCKDTDNEVSIASKKILGGLADLSVEDGETYQITFHQSRDKISAKKKRTRREAGLQESTVILTWERAMEIDVVFADGTRDKIQLRAVSNIPGEATPCLFTGSLLKDQESYVTVIGCQGDSEVVVEIISEKIAVELYLSNGKTYEVTPDNTSSRGRADDALVPDSQEIGSIAAQAMVGPLPESVILEISLRYDNSLLAELGNNSSKVKQWLSNVVQFAKPRMAMIDLSVDLRVVGTVEHFSKSIRATHFWIHEIAKTENKGQKGPISYFSAGIGNGIAWVGTACYTSGKQININEKARTSLATARTFVHELGHNIGMWHDFDPRHGGKIGSNGYAVGSNTAGCEGDGLMSCGSKTDTWNLSQRPDAWSTCSNDDFKDWYKTTGHQCLRNGPEAPLKPEVVQSTEHSANFPATSLLILGEEDGWLPDGNTNFWLAEHQKTTGQGFTIKVDKGPRMIAGCQIKNKGVGLNTGSQFWATKEFQVSGSLGQDGPWETLLEDELSNTLSKPAALRTFTFTEPKETQFLKFELVSYWGTNGGGLQYFAAIPATRDSVLLITGGVGKASTEVFPSCSSPPPLPSTRYYHQSFKTSDPTPLIASCGGRTGWTATASRTCLVLNLENQRWDESRMGNLTTPRYEGAVVELKQGVLFLGGWGSATSKTTSDFLATGSLQWQQGPRLPQAMTSFCAVPVSPTKFLTIRGDKIHEFDAAIAGPTSEEGWRDSTLWPTLKTRRVGHSCTKHGDTVILAGGYDYGGDINLQSTLILDITTRTISTGGDMATPRHNFNLATISRGGGETTFAIAGGSSSEILNSVEEWEEESSTWKAAGNLDTARTRFGVVTIPKKIICPT